MKNAWTERIEQLEKENKALKRQIEISKKRIIEVLEKYQIREIDKGKDKIAWDRTPNQIASEILGDYKIEPLKKSKQDEEFIKMRLANEVEILGR